MVLTTSAIVNAFPGSERAQEIPNTNHQVLKGSVGNGTLLRIMPIGASITWGQGSSDGKSFNQQYCKRKGVSIALIKIAGNGYREKLQNSLIASGNPVQYVGSQQSGTMANNLTEGYPGLRIEQVHPKVLPALTRFLPNLVLILLGSNGIPSFGFRVRANSLLILTSRLYPKLLDP